MKETRLPDYLDHMREAATNARNFVEGMKKEDFLADKRTQQAVIMSLVIIGEVATKIMDRYPGFARSGSAMAVFRADLRFIGCSSVGYSRIGPLEGQA
jgi:hypothetical protein